MSNDIDMESSENKRFAGTSEWWTQTPENVKVEPKEEHKLPKEIESMLSEIENIAKEVVGEYKKDNSDNSEMTIEVNENSPWLSHSFNWHDEDNEEE